MKTTLLNDGTEVLAHGGAYGVTPYTYSNRAQAHRAAMKYGGDVIRRGRPFFVRMYTERPWREAYPENPTL